MNPNTSIQGTISEALEALKQNDNKNAALILNQLLTKLSDFPAAIRLLIKIERLPNTKDCQVSILGEREDPSASLSIGIILSDQAGQTQARGIYSFDESNENLNWVENQQPAAIYRHPLAGKSIEADDWQQWPFDQIAGERCLNCSVILIEKAGQICCPNCTEIHRDADEYFWGND